jgi:hypothetical protein
MGLSYPFPKSLKLLRKKRFPSRNFQVSLLSKSCANYVAMFLNNQRIFHLSLWFKWNV